MVNELRACMCTCMAFLVIVFVALVGRRLSCSVEERLCMLELQEEANSSRLFFLQQTNLISNADQEEMRGRRLRFSRTLQTSTRLKCTPPI